MSIGVYIITNTISGDFYIGSSAVSISGRFKSHTKRLSSGKHENPRLQNAWNKYGELAFKFEILEETIKEEVLNREQFFINTLKPQYNICKIAGNCSGRKFSEETKRKLSDKKKNGKDFIPLVEFNKTQLKLKYPNDTDSLRTCKHCISVKSKDSFVGHSRKCKSCFNLMRKSRSVEGSKQTYYKSLKKPVIAVGENFILQFDGLRDAAKFLQGTANKTGIRLAIQNNKKYYNFNWSFV